MQSRFSAYPARIARIARIDCVNRKRACPTKGLFPIGGQPFFIKNTKKMISIHDFSKKIAKKYCIIIL